MTEKKVDAIMAIYKKVSDGVFYYNVYAAGRRLSGSCRTKDKAEAQMVENLVKAAIGSVSPKEKLIRLINAIYDDEPEQKDDVPLEQLYFDFERIARITSVSVSLSTVKERQREMVNFIEWCRKHCPRVTSLRSVDRVASQSYASYLQRSGKANKTIRNNLCVLQSMWNVLKRGHDDLSNPWPLAIPPKTEKVVRDAFTPEQARAIFKAADDTLPEWGTVCRIAAATGLRFGDIVTLQYEDIIGGQICISPNKTKAHGISVRTPLPDVILHRIGTGTGAVFPYMSARYVDKYYNGRPRFSDIMERAGITDKGLTFHSFRHYFRTRLAEAGVSEDVAMRLGGWSQRETARRYDHAELFEAKKAAVDKCWAALELPPMS